MDKKAEFSNLYNQALYGYNLKNIIHSEDNLVSLAKTYKENAVIFSLVDWKASRMSEIKPELYEIKNRDLAKEFKKWNGKYTEEYEIKKLKEVKLKAYEEIDLESVSENHLTYGKIKKILRQPNYLMSWKKFVYHYSASKDVSGFQPIWGNRLDYGTNKGLFEELYPLPAHLTEIISGGIMKPIKSYRVKIHDWLAEFINEDVLMLANHSFDYDLMGSQLYGTSRVKAAFQELETYNNAKDRELYSYQTGDAQTIVFPKDLQVAESANDDTNKPMIDKWLTGVRNLFKQKTRDGVSFAPYSLDAIKIGTPLKDSNTSESKKEAISRICGVWHINPIIIGENATNTDAKIKEVTKMALRDGVLPEARELNEGLNDFWMSTYKQKGANVELVFDYDVYEEFSTDIRETADALSKIDFLSDNEKRMDWFGYDKLEDEKADTPQKYWDIELDPINYDNSEPSI